MWSFTLPLHILLKHVSIMSINKFSSGTRVSSLKYIYKHSTYRPSVRHAIYTKEGFRPVFSKTYEIILKISKLHDSNSKEYLQGHRKSLCLGGGGKI